MTDIVAELRRLYDDSITDGDRSWVAVENDEYCDLFSGRRAIDVGRIVAAEDARLIVAMHNHLPQLLDVVEAVQEWRNERRGDYSSEMAYDAYKATARQLEAALAALDRSGQ